MCLAVIYANINMSQHNDIYSIKKTVFQYLEGGYLTKSLKEKSLQQAASDTSCTASSVSRSPKFDNTSKRETEFWKTTQETAWLTLRR
jgi:hypothetical protein